MEGKADLSEKALSLKELILVKAQSVKHLPCTRKVLSQSPVGLHFGRLLGKAQMIDADT